MKAPTATLELKRRLRLYARRAFRTMYRCLGCKLHLSKISSNMRSQVQFPLSDFQQ